MTFLYYFLLTLFLLLSVLTCAVVLVQESKSSGLGASFGGGEAGESLFGTSTPEILKTITAYLAIIFLVGCVVLSLWTSSLARFKTPSVTTEEILER